MLGVIEWRNSLAIGAERLVFAFEKTRQVDEPMSAHCYCVKTEALIKSEPSL